MTTASTEQGMKKEEAAAMTASEGGLVASGSMRSLAYRTILDDQTNYHVKHPLQSHWTLFQKVGQVDGASSRGVSQEAWQLKLNESVTIGTVEDFWCLYKSMQDVNTIPVDCDYFFMREGVKPMWEDAANKGGCELRIAMQRNYDSNNLWKMTLLLAVGAQLKDFQHLTGVQFAFRKAKSRISIWLAACPSETLSRIQDEFTAAMEEAIGQGVGCARVDISWFDKGPSAADRGGADRGGERRERPTDRYNSERGGGWARGGGRGSGSYRGGHRSDRDSPRDSRDDRRRPF